MQRGVCKFTFLFTRFIVSKSFCLHVDLSPPYRYGFISTNDDDVSVDVWMFDVPFISMMQSSGESSTRKQNLDNGTVHETNYPDKCSITSLGLGYARRFLSSHFALIHLQL